MSAIAGTAALEQRLEHLTTPLAVVLPGGQRVGSRNVKTRPIGRPRLHCGEVVRSITRPERSEKRSIDSIISPASISASRRMYSRGSATWGTWSRR